MDDIFLKLIKFSLVGLVGLFIDFGITYLLKEKGHINKYLANALGFMSAVSNNFILNKKWTFEDIQDIILYQYIIYFCIALVGLAINQIVLYTSHTRFNIGFYYAKAIATLCVVVWNFTLNYWITFSV